MDRRESIKNLLIGAAATSALFTAAGCEPETDGAQQAKHTADYPFEGTRTEEELRQQARLHAVGSFFNEKEKNNLNLLADIIIPADESGPAASSTGLTDFIEFMSLDFPDFQLPLRAGLSWLSRTSLERYQQNDFAALTPEQRLSIIDEIAYLPEAPEEIPTPPVAFFHLLRQLVLTGYFTSKEGIKALGYQGNYANVWDGPPAEVLQKHGISGEEAWLSKCIDQEQRNEIARWDEQGNLI
jgi:hypothetical protein